MAFEQKITIGGVSIGSGERKRLELNVATLFDFTPMTIPVEVICGKENGPTLFLSAAIHGDEINGTEIIKRILNKKINFKDLRGTLIAVPIVNVFGFNRNIRYLPDRRDLNRCFPGKSGGSLAGQIAHTFMEEIVAKSTHGIDFHTGAIHRFNLPQIRACLNDPETKCLALASGLPVILNSDLRDGSLRQAARERGIPMLLFEGGEALRYDEKVIQAGIQCVLNVMASIGMTKNKKISAATRKVPHIALSSRWIRAPLSGSLRVHKYIGNVVQVGDVLGTISDPFGGNSIELQAPEEGVIVGISQLPLLNQGDAVFHIANFKNTTGVEESVALLDTENSALYDSMI